MNEIRWLLAGTGDIVRKRVVAALQAAPHSRVVGVCSGRPENARSLAAELDGAAAFPDFESALTGSGADAVYLATPVSLHAPHAVAALEAGKHVLVEKPLALDGADADRIVQGAERSGCKAGCAYYRRCSPRYAQAREMLASGALGEIVLARMVYFGWFAPSASDPKFWRVCRARSGGGPLADIGSHMLDVMIGLLGMPVRVSAASGNVVHDWDVEDSVAAVLSMQNGAQATASFHWNSRTWRHEFELVGTEAKLCWSPFDTGPVVKTVGREIEELELPPADNVHEPLIRDFEEAIIDDRPPVVTVAEAAKTTQVIDAITRAASEHREIALQVD